MRVGLYGIRGTYNFGCEAIVRGATKLLRSKYGDCSIIYYSYDYENDAKRLADLGIEIARIEEKRTFLKRALNKLLYLTKQEKRILYIPYRSMIDGIDMLLSIGGDIYTIPSYLRKQKKYNYYNHLIDFCDRAIAKGKRVIAYGASIGPFGEYTKAVDYYRENLKKYEAILCREQDSIDYLEGLGCGNARFFPDPAFTVRLEEDVRADKRYIGVNLSPLSLNETNGQYGENDIDCLASLMDTLSTRMEEELLFIPHVVSESINDDDYRFMCKIRDKMRNKNKTTVADYTGGFLGIKKQLHECKIVISARMHCAINALCESIPTLLISYSQKSIGMCKYVYGNDDWIIKVEDIGECLIDKAAKLYDAKDNIVPFLENRNREIMSYVESNREDIL